MPIYEYKCSKCGRVTEVLQKSSAAAPPKCDKCGSIKMEKLFSTFAALPTGQSSRCETCSDGSCPMSRGH